MVVDVAASSLLVVEVADDDDGAFLPLPNFLLGVDFRPSVLALPLPFGVTAFGLANAGSSLTLAAGARSLTWAEWMRIGDGWIGQGMVGR